MKPPTACLQCRERKLRCTSIGAGLPCKKCTSTQRQCSWVPAPTPKRAPTGPNIAGLEKSTVTRIVDDYVRYLHDRPHSLFHVPSLKRAVYEDALDPALLLAICSLGCRFAPDSGTRNQCIPLFHKAAALFQTQMENVTIHSLQTCILLANVCSAESKPSSEAMYFGGYCRHPIPLPPTPNNILT